MESNFDAIDDFEQICRLLEVDTLEEAVSQVRILKGEIERLRALLNSIAITSVVMIGGQPLFVQMPPIIPQREYPTEVLEMVRDALVDASTSLRLPIQQSRTPAYAPDEALRSEASAKPPGGTGGRSAGAGVPNEHKSD